MLDAARSATQRSTLTRHLRRSGSAGAKALGSRGGRPATAPHSICTSFVTVQQHLEDFNIDESHVVAELVLLHGGAGVRV